MAEKIVWQLGIDGLKENMLSVKDLKQSLKDAKNELLQFEAGTEGFNKAQIKVSALKDKLDGIGDSARIQGTGVERLQQSFSLLTESLGSGDVDKAKLAFTGLGQAMSAIPIFLLIEGVKLLAENWDKASDAIMGFFGYADEAKAKVDSLTEAIKEQEGQLTILKATIQSEIDVMVAQGAGVDSILAKKKELMKLQVDEINQLIEVNKAKLESAKADNLLVDTGNAVINVILAKTIGLDFAAKRAANLEIEKINRQKEIQTEIDKLEATKITLQSKFAVEEITTNNKKNEDKKKSNNAYYKSKHDSEDADRKRQEEYDEWLRKRAIEWQGQDESNEQKLVDELNAKLKAEQEYATESKRISDELAGQIFDQKIRSAQKEDELALAQAQKEMELAKQVLAEKEKIEKQYFMAARGLSQALFAFQLRQAEGNSKEELRIKKEAFQVDKAFQIAQATIDGYRATLSAYATAPPGLKIAAAVAAGLFATAEIAKIAATKFNGGGSSSTPASSSSPSVATSSQAPAISQPTNQVKSTLLSEEGKEQTQAERDKSVVRAYIIQHELNSKVNDYKRVKEQSKF